MIPNASVVRYSALVSLALVTLLIPLASATASGVEFVTIRVDDGSESVRIEMPVAILDYVLQHTGADLDMGRVNGREVRFPKEALQKILRGSDAREKDILVFTVRDGQKESRIFVRTQVRTVPKTLRKPMYVFFSVKDKTGKESVRLGISIDTIDSWASGYGKGDSDDFGPFVRACLAQAKKLGRGPILQIEGADGTVSFQVE